MAAALAAAGIVAGGAAVADAVQAGAAQQAGQQSAAERRADIKQTQAALGVSRQQAAVIVDQTRVAGGATNPLAVVVPLAATGAALAAGSAVRGAGGTVGGPRVLAGRTGQIGGRVVFGEGPSAASVSGPIRTPAPSGVGRVGRGLVQAGRSGLNIIGGLAAQPAAVGKRILQAQGPGGATGGAGTQ